MFNVTRDQSDQILSEFCKLCPDFYEDPDGKNVDTLLEWVSGNGLPISPEILGVAFLKTKAQMTPTPPKPVKFVQHEDTGGRINHSRPPEPDKHNWTQHLLDGAKKASVMASLAVELNEARSACFHFSHARRPGEEKEACGRVKRAYISRYPSLEAEIRAFQT